MASAADGWTWLYLGRVLAGTADVLRDRWLAYALTASLLVGVPAAVARAVPLPDDRLAGLVLPGSPAAALLVAASLLAALYATVALLRDSLALLAGERPAFRASLAEAWGWLPRAVAVQLVTSFLVLAGLVLLIVPGLVAAVFLFFALPAMIGERLGLVASLRRSRELGRGARWDLFPLVLAIVFGPQLAA